MHSAIKTAGLALMFALGIALTVYLSIQDYSWLIRYAR